MSPLKIRPDDGCFYMERADYYSGLEYKYGVYMSGEEALKKADLPFYNMNYVSHSGETRRWVFIFSSRKLRR